MRVLLAVLAALIASPAVAQVTTAKPSAYVLDTGETYYPDHLWMVDEGTGTTLEDLIGTWDLTMAGGNPDWGTDGTHGPKLTFTAANAERLVRTTLSGLSGTIGLCAIVTKASDPGSATSLMNFGASSGDTNAAIRITTAGTLIRRAVQEGGTPVSGTSSYDLVAAGGYQVVCLRATDSEVAVSMQGGTFSTTAHTFTGLVASFDILAIGCEVDSGAAICSDFEMIALFAYEGAGSPTIDNTMMAAIGVANPWPVIGVDLNVAPSFSVAPAESTNTTTTVLVTYTASEASTLHWAIRNSGTSAYADCAAVDAGSGAIAAGNEASSADVLLTFLHYEGDIDLCLETMAGVSAVATLNDVVRNVCTGCAAIELTALSGTSPFTVPVDTVGDVTEDSAEITGMASTELFAVNSLVTVNSGFADTVLMIVAKTATSITVDQVATSTVANRTITGHVDTSGTTLISPTPAAGDWLEYDTIGATITWDSGWDVDDAGGAGYLELPVCPQDISDTSPEFAAPLNCRTTAFHDFILGNVAPSFDIEDIAEIALPVGVAIDTIPIGGMCSHANLTPIVSIRSGDSLPMGLSLASGEIDGTLSGETTFTVQFWCGADTLFDLETWTAHGVVTWTMPSVTGLTVAGALEDIVAAAPWRSAEGIGQDEECSGAMDDVVLTQDPAASAEIAAYAAITLVVSTGRICRNPLHGPLHGPFLR